jgi:RNA polymerase sigma-70 factor (ECF subfamily)
VSRWVLGRTAPASAPRTGATDRARTIALLYDAHVEEVYRFVHRRCRDHDIAEDITQETFMKAVRSTIAPQSLTVGWLMTVARNQLIDVLRRQTRHEEKLRLVGATQAADDPVDPVERLRMEAALAELSVDHRLVLTLHYVDGMSVPDLATHLGRSMKSVEGLVTRARRHLRVSLDDETDSPQIGGTHG